LRHSYSLPKTCSSFRVTQLPGCGSPCWWVACQELQSFIQPSLPVGKHRDLSTSRYRTWPSFPPGGRQGGSFPVLAGQGCLPAVLRLGGSLPIHAGPELPLFLQAHPLLKASPADHNIPLLHSLWGTDQTGCGCATLSLNPPYFGTPPLKIYVSVSRLRCYTSRTSKARYTPKI
jgi:hypothetical protein